MENSIEDTETGRKLVCRWERPGLVLHRQKQIKALTAPKSNY